MKKRLNVLVIDTTKIGILCIGMLESEHLVNERIFTYAHGSSFLKYLKCYMKDMKLKEEILKGIALVQGAGSFSATRAGICVLNTLQWTKNIKAASFDYRAYADDAVLYRDIACFSWNTASKPLIPLYQSAPHITVSRKKSFSCI